MMLSRKLLHEMGYSYLRDTTLAQRPHAEGPEPHLQFLLVAAHAMDLEGDEAGPYPVVVQVSGRHLVEPGANGSSVAFDAELVPFPRAESLARRFVGFQIIQPAACAFLIQAAGPG